MNHLVVQYTHMEFTLGMGKRALGPFESKRSQGTRLRIFGYGEDPSELTAQRVKLDGE